LLVLTAIMQHLYNIWLRL